MIRRFSRLAAVCITVAVAAVAVVNGRETPAQDKNESLVNVAATASTIGADGGQTVTIKMQIHPDWHAYANPVQDKDLASNATAVKIEAASKPEVKLNYPAGKRHVDGHFVYEGIVEIQATVKRAIGDTSPLQLTVEIFICNDKTQQCLPGKTATGECSAAKTVTLKVK